MPELVDRKITTLPEQKPHMISEPTIELPDKRVAVIGTEHGYGDEPFPGRLQTEAEMRIHFGAAKADGIVLDSLLPLEGETQSIDNVKMIPDELEEKLSILNWGTRKAIREGSYIIGGDIVFMAPVFVDIVRLDLLAGSKLISMISSQKQVRENPEYQENQAKIQILAKSEEAISQAEMAANLVLCTAGLYYGMKAIEQRRMTRRQFLKIVGAGGAAAGLRLVKESVLGQVRAVKAGYQMAVNKILKEAGYEGFETILADRLLPTIRREDFDKLKDLASQPGVIQPEDLRNPDFQKTIDRNEASEYVVALRNAIVADVMTLPTSEIMPGYSGEKKPDIAVIMGWGHLTVSEKNSISYFIKHEEERKQTVKQLMQALKIAIEDGIFGVDVTWERFREELKDVGKSYKISPEGKLEVFRYKIPALEQALED